jgi:hypothetical protein
MASRTESSSTKNVIVIPAKRNKPPEKPPLPPSTPRSSPPALSYADAVITDQAATPKQSRKRTAGDLNLNDAERRPLPAHPISPSRRASLPSIPLRFIQNEQRATSPDTTDPDQEMDDPFVAQPAYEELTDWEEEGRYMDRLTKIQELLREIRRELYEAKRESNYEDIIRNQEVSIQLAELASHLPHAANPMLSGIANVQKLLENLTMKLQKADCAFPPDPIDRSL